MQDDIPDCDVDASLQAAVVDALILAAGRPMLGLPIEQMAKVVIDTLFASHTAWAVRSRLSRSEGHTNAR